VFASASEVKISIWKYAIANRFEYKYVQNCWQRIAVKCIAEGCGFYICVRGHLKRGGMYVKEFEPGHVHSVGAKCQIGKWGRRRIQASLLGTLIEGKVRLSDNCTPSEILKDLQLEMGMMVSYMQCWRAREYVRLLANRRPEHHYKLLPWMCTAIVRANPDSRAFCELQGSRFKRLFVAYGALLNGFILGCRKILFVDGAHLSGPYEGTILSVIALDADDHLFDVAYAVVSTENVDEWLWFLTVLHECLGGMQPVIMSDRNQGLLSAMPRVFGIDYHSYSLQHV